MIAKEKWKIDPQKTALVVVDMQRFALDKGSFSETRGARELIPRLNELADMCRRLKIPVIYLCQSNRADLSDIGLLRDFWSLQLDSDLVHLEGRRGVELYPGLNVAPDDYIVTKLRYSAFISGSSNLEPLLRGLDRDRFIICGTAIEGSVFLTAAGGMMLSFKVFCVSDLTGNVGQAEAFTHILNRRIAKVMTFEEIKKELEQLMDKGSV